MPFGELLMEQKGKDIELLQSMDSLIDVWRTIAQRALTATQYLQPRLQEAIETEDNSD